jgi:hypothetical protein
VILKEWGLFLVLVAELAGFGWLRWQPFHGPAVRIQALAVQEGRLYVEEWGGATLADWLRQDAIDPQTGVLLEREVLARSPQRSQAFGRSAALDPGFIELPKRHASFKLQDDKHFLRTRCAGERSTTRVLGARDPDGPFALSADELARLDDQGDVRWKLRLEALGGAPLPDAGAEMVCPVRGVLVFALDRGRLVGVDAKTGNVLWHTQL